MRHTRHPRRPGAGFTLVEMLIAIVIVGVLATVALPAFNDAIRKSRRSDALVALSAVQQAQERWRSNNAAYATNAQLVLPTTAEDGEVGLGLSATTPDGYYAVAITDDIDSAVGYIATATAVSGKSQTEDAGCQFMAVRQTGGNVSYGSGASASAVDWTDPKRCWAR